MAVIDKPDLKYGFWVGLGLLLAFLIWRLATTAISRARSRG